MSRSRPLALLGILGSGLLALGSWAEGIDDSKRAVEAIRGLPFRAPVRVITIDRSELPARLEDQFAKTLPYAADEWEKILRTLLLVEERGDVMPSLIALYQSQVLAY